MSRAELRRRLDDGHGSERGAVSELHFFGGGGAWAVLGALVVSVASFTSLLAWPTLGGGALLPLRTTVAALWEDATWGLRGVGVDLVGPADPFAAVVAVLGSLWPAGPSFSLVLLWILALPLAVLGGWFAATRVTDRSGLRIFAGIAWALAPTFLVALVDGRPTGVLVHLLLPWLFHSAVVAHRSWGAAGAASIVFAAVTACSPSLAPALLILWVVAIIITLAGRRVRGAARLLWLPIPAVAMFAPLVIRHLRSGDLLSLLGDPGAIWAGPQAAADAAGRLALATGFPSTDFAGWTTLLGVEIGSWAGVLLAPLVLLALLAALAPRWRAGITLLLVGAAGLATALLAVGVFVSFTQGTPVAIWPGAGLSLAWIGIVGAALVTLDTMLTAPRVRTIAALVASVALVVCAAPALLAFHTDRSVLTDGPTSTLPALVVAQAGSEHPVGTLVLTPQNDGGLAAEVAWGVSETLGSQSTLLSTATEVVGTDITALSVDLISARDFDAVDELTALGIRNVLLAQVHDEGDRARTLRTSAVTSLNQRAGFVQAGTTARGELWSIDAEITRAAPSTATRATGHLVATVQLVVILAALLLAIPTRASRRAARARSRIVGRAPDEPLVLPRHAEEAELERTELASLPAADVAAGEQSAADAADSQRGAGETVPADAAAAASADNVAPVGTEVSAENAESPAADEPTSTEQTTTPSDGPRPDATEDQR